MRVLIAGSRDWTDEAPIRELIGSLPHHAVLVHGACPSGADSIADAAARERGLRIERFPADWSGQGRSAGPKRNTRMLEEGKPELIFAFRSAGESRGTDDLVRKAKGRAIPTIVTMEGGDQEGSYGTAWTQLTIE